MLVYFKIETNDLEIVLMKKYCKKISVLLLAGILLANISESNFIRNANDTYLLLNKESISNSNIESYSYGNDDESIWY